MCKYSYSEFSERTKRDMLYCSNPDFKPSSERLCLCQRYCPDKARYIPHNQDKLHCKYCIDS